jgi:hypothetical protein
MGSNLKAPNPPSPVSLKRKECEEEEAEFPPFASVASVALHAQLFRRLFHLLLQRALFHSEGDLSKSPPFISKTPRELEAAFDFRIHQKGTSSHEALLDLLAKVIEYSPKLSHPLSLSKHSNGYADNVSSPINPGIRICNPGS